MNLSTKQIELLNEVTTCERDNKEEDDEYMKRVAAFGIPTIFSPMINEVTFNYEDNIGDCKMRRANILMNVYDLYPFSNAMEEISNNEILLYRSRLENQLQKGLHALIEIQFLDTLVILQKQTCNEKLKFDSDLKNIMFLMKNLVSLFRLNPPTVANEIYEQEKIKASNEANIDVIYKSPEDVEALLMNIELKSLSLALAKQHNCLIDNTLRKKGNIYLYFNLYNFILVCQAKSHNKFNRNIIIA